MYVLPLQSNHYRSLSQTRFSEPSLGRKYVPETTCTLPTTEEMEVFIAILQLAGIIGACTRAGR